MLKTFVILALCIVAIKASGNLYVLDTPNSLEFRGSEKLASENVGDVLSACLGNWVDDAIKWGGLYIIDPFSPPKNALVFIFSGIPEIHLKSQSKSYQLTGSSSRESINALSSEVESYYFMVDFDQMSEAVDKITDEFGEMKAKVEPFKSTNFLKPDLHLADKEFLTQISLLLELIEKVLASQQPPTMVTAHISLEPIAKTHGEKSPAMAEAIKIVANILEKLNQSPKADKLIIAVTEKSEPNRAKRETGDAASAKSLNLAAYYDEDYPVIFNIILWFMVVLGFSLLAICYAIGSMDPGRDSIIYRMTSTRMKKDN